MKRLIFLAIIVTVFLDCGQENPLINQEVNADCRKRYASCDIMPLAVGNTWTYEAVGYDSLGGIEYIITFVITIARDTVINDEVWYLESPGSTWYTNRDDGLWSFINTYNNLRRLYRYPVESTDSNIISLDTTMSVNSSLYYCCVYYGMFPSWWETYTYMAPGVGRVKACRYFINFGGTKYLGLVEELISYSLK